MTKTGTLKVAIPIDREIMMTVVNAQRSVIFDAWTKPELFKPLELRPDGWSLPACEIDLQVGGSIPYVWRGLNGTEMVTRGVYREIV
jgi:uncharacterized protein YndB with AHSA1/START domain